MDIHNLHILLKLRQQLHVLEYDPAIRLQENQLRVISISLTHAFLYPHYRFKLVVAIRHRIDGGIFLSILFFLYNEWNATLDGSSYKAKEYSSDTI